MRNCRRSWAARWSFTEPPAAGVRSQPSIGAFSRARAACRSPAGGELLPEYLTRLDAGTGAFEVLARGQGATLARADVDFSARGVVATLADGPSAAFEQISGALTATHAGDRWTVLGRHVQAQRARHRDPDSEFDVSWRADDTGLLELRARASYLRAEALLPLAGLMPQKDIRERLRDIAPTGEWMDMRLQLMRGQVASPWKLQVNARFRDVGFAPVGRAPGLRGLNGILAGDESGGRLAIESHGRGVFLARRVSPADQSDPAEIHALLEAH